MMVAGSQSIRVRQRLGKYRIQKRIAEGGFATVYQAYDTVAGITVAIKIPHAQMMSREALDGFRKEVRLSAKLDHPNILPIKDAGEIDGTFVIVYPLGEESLADRITRRMSTKTAVSMMEQMLEAVAVAHRQRILHCDIKPENFIIFPENRLRLADFGIARIAMRTLVASGTGTVGYMAPEQAMGKPSLRSDVFSLGMIFYRMLTGSLPEWPFDWPMPGHARLARTVHPKMIGFLKRSLSVDSRQRFADAGRMLSAFSRIRSGILRAKNAARSRRTSKNTTNSDWRTIRRREFLRKYRRELELRSNCRRCQGPLAETMHHCPWCSTRIARWQDDVRFRKRCPRCKRGVKSDWRFCPWCYGAAINPDAEPQYSDVRYEKKCQNRKCPGEWMMPFMKYCPWCRQKSTTRWRFTGADGKCPRCRWDVVTGDWEACAWCGRKLSGRK
ncbi:MAG: protein kinase domain-containing protein [Planctomycetota bacterium]|jgi:serine/threonine-protein kinase